MPPKKSKAKASSLPSHPKQEDETKKVEQAAEEENNDAAEEPPAENGTADTKKRKTPPTSGKSQPPKKEPRQGSRTSSRTAGASSFATSRQLLNFLLSKDSLPYCFPEDELKAARSDKNLRTYSLTSPGEFSAFEQLLIAHLLSKPLSHTLGMRSIRTLLNPPYSFTTPEKIVEVGEDKVWEALETARTQHRQKTASYIYQMGQEYTDSDTMLALAEAANDEGHDGVVAHIKETIKGMGATGAELFCRRIQSVDGWGEAIWPCSDARCLGALREIGVNVKSADELQSMLESDIDWQKIGDMGLNEKKISKGELANEDMELQVAAEFVVVLERAVGAQLEGKISELKKAAESWK